MYTWNNRRGGDHQIVVHSDRFLVLETMFHLQQTISIDILPFNGSDHWPIVLSWEGRLKPCQRPFRFERFRWSTQNFYQILQPGGGKDLIYMGLRCIRCKQKLKHGKTKIRKWKKEVFGNIFEEKHALNKRWKSFKKR
jgi:hypothetical protein